MTEIQPIDKLRACLARHSAARSDPPFTPPLAINPWQAMSLLQKAVRRGQLDLALGATSTLLDSAPDRFWRRTGVIAFEDVGVWQTCRRSALSRHPLAANARAVALVASGLWRP